MHIKPAEAQEKQRSSSLSVDACKNISQKCH